MCLEEFRKVFRRSAVRKLREYSSQIAPVVALSAQKNISSKTAFLPRIVSVSSPVTSE